MAAKKYNNMEEKLRKKVKNDGFFFLSLFFMKKICGRRKNFRIFIMKIGHNENVFFMFEKKEEKKTRKRKI